MGADKDSKAKGGKGSDGKQKEENAAVAAAAKKVEEVKQEVPLTPWEVLLKNATLLIKAVTEKDERLMRKAIRSTTQIRATMTPERLGKAVSTLLVAGEQQTALAAHAAAIAQLEKQAAGDEDVDMDAADAAGETKEAEPAAAAAAKPAVKAPAASDLPELIAYLYLLTLAQYAKYNAWQQHAAAAGAAIGFVNTHNRRTLDFLSAKAYSALSLAHEHLGTLSTIRDALTRAHRTACLRHDDMGRATLLNLLLRNYLHYNLFDQAYKFMAHSSFPEAVSNNQLVRYLYYCGRIHAVQLNYTDAHACLQQAARKAPTATALGFRQTVQKLSIIVQLLMGEVPDRTAFRQPDTRGALASHEKLSSAVRVGNLDQFSQIMAAHSAQFQKERTLGLVLRLRQNVIRAGLRKIALSYSQISFADIASKLRLESAVDAEFLCAKAIKDGVISAVLNHETGALHSKDSVNVYSTLEPQAAFHKRISFCMDVHNEAVKSMLYATTSKTKTDDEDAPMDEEEIAEEIAAALAEAEED